MFLDLKILFSFISEQKCKCACYVNHIVTLTN